MQSKQARVANNENQQVKEAKREDNEYVSSVRRVETRRDEKDRKKHLAEHSPQLGSEANHPIPSQTFPPYFSSLVPLMAKTPKQTTPEPPNKQKTKVSY
jgi:hypothetical protein